MPRNTAHQLKNQKYRSKHVKYDLTINGLMGVEICTQMPVRSENFLHNSRVHPRVVILQAINTLHTILHVPTEHYNWSVARIIIAKEPL